MVIVVIKKKFVTEVMGRSTIYLFKPTIDIEYLEGMVTANEESTDYLTRLKTISEKLKSLGIETKVEVEISDFINNYVEITAHESDEILKIYVTIPEKKKEWTVFKEIRQKHGKEFDEELYRKLIELAITQKQKAIDFLEKLEKEGLIVYVEEPSRDC